MDIYFSPSTGGFYDEAIHGKFTELPTDEPPGLIPADAVLISRERHLELLEAQGAGQIITAHEGAPVAVELPPDPAKVAIHRRAVRNRLLQDCDWTQLADVMLDRPKLKSAWAAYRQQLRELDMAGTDWPSAPTSEPGV